MLTRIACSKSIQKKITSWRKEHNDWEALAAFALSKTTGRRFKNKAHSDSNSVSAVSSSGENAVAQTSVPEKTATNISVRKPDEKLLDSAGCRDQKSQSRTSSEANKPSETKDVPNASHYNEQAAECVGPSDRCPSASHSNVVVRQISLDELSDEELFLPPPDEETSECIQAAMRPSSGTKIGSGFFVVSDEDDSDAEIPTTKALSRTEASSSDADGEDVTSTTMLRNSVKLSTMFARSLSHHQPRNSDKAGGRDRKWKSSMSENRRQNVKERKHSDGKRFSDKPYTKSRGSFPNMHGSRYPKKNEKHPRYKLKTKYVEWYNNETCVSVFLKLLIILITDG